MFSRLNSRSNLTLLRNLHKAPHFRTQAITNEKDENPLKKLIYNSVFDKRRNHPRDSRKKALKHLYKEKGIIRTELDSNPIPISLRLITDYTLPEKVHDEPQEDIKITHFPFSSNTNITQISSKEVERIVANDAETIKAEINQRFEQQKEMKNWMTAYDNYDETSIEEDEIDLNSWRVNYGTSDPSSRISNIPCGGCGALLHCKEPAIPGYIPSEIFKNSKAQGSSNLESIVCQRCHFLKNYNVALQTRINPEDYPKVLASICDQKPLLVLLVDLLDMPCSIWPGIGEIFANRCPIVIVGNKVDLLPQDSRKYLDNIRNVLLNQVKLSGFATRNIKHVALISAKTGYGVEDLITNLNSLYKQKGNVYILGSTNVGKSTLFNSLIQSDYCKSQAMDLIQRATTSVWPGTTLNLLKFPIRRPSGYIQYLRQKRLSEVAKLQKEEDRLRKDQLRSTKNREFATLIGHIDITRNPFKDFDPSKDEFHNAAHNNASGVFRMGLNEKSMDYAYGKWCYDTPGVVQRDHVTHLLTTEELLLTLPKELILPRTFCIKPGSSLFIGGLARLDYLEGNGSVRFTVFAADTLPITVCPVNDAEELYRKLLGTELLAVPMKGAERLAKWPNLELAQNFSITGEDWQKSVIDVVLSSSGWIALTGKPLEQYKFAAWTPEKRGVHLRDCVLPYAVSQRGARIKNSVAYEKHRFYLKQ